MCIRDRSPCGDAVASFPSAGGDAAGAVGDDEDDRADGGGELDEDGLVPSAVDVPADVADVADHDGGGPRDPRSSPWGGGATALGHICVSETNATRVAFIMPPVVAVVMEFVTATPLLPQAWRRFQTSDRRVRQVCRHLREQSMLHLRLRQAAAPCVGSK